MSNRQTHFYDIGFEVSDCFRKSRQRQSQRKAIMEHLTNCHGEWTAMMALAGYLSFISLWIRLRLQSFRRQKNDNR